MKKNQSHEYHSKRKENHVQSLARSPYEIDHSLTGIFKLKFENASIGIRYSIFGRSVFIGIYIPFF